MIVCLMIDCKGEGHRENLEKALRGMGYVTYDATKEVSYAIDEGNGNLKEIADYLAR